MISTSLTQRYHLSAEQMLSEDALVRAAQSDSKKFEPLYNKYFEQVFRFIYQRVAEKESAADITAQVFLKAMLNLSKYEPRGVPFSAWLFRIAKNELADLFRKRRHERIVNIDAEGMKEVMEEMQEDNYADYHDRLAHVMASLHEEDLCLVEMRFFEKRSFKEIGDILGITENNSKVKLYRLLGKMKSLITSKK